MKVLNIYYFDESILLPYEEALRTIIAIDHPVSMKIAKTNIFSDIIKEIYAPYSKSRNNFKWLIPYFENSMWWIELEITDIDVISNYLFKSGLFEITVVDLEFNFIFDSEMNNDNYDIRVLDLN